MRCYQRIYWACLRMPGTLRTCFRGCFIPEWRQGLTHCLRTEMLYGASCYARTLMNFVDDSRSPPSAFATILDDPALPIFMQLLGTCLNPSMAHLGLCDNHRFLHQK